VDTDQNKIDAVTARLTGFTPIHVVREKVVAWMRENKDRCLLGRNDKWVKFLAVSKIWKIRREDWLTLLAEAGTDRPKP